MLKIAVMALALALAASSGAAAGRYDPYKSYRFVLYRNGRPVAGANQVDLPAAKGDVVDYRAGGDPGLFRKSPGRNKFGQITLKRGVTQDSGFANWAAGAGAGPHASLRLKAFDPAGRVQASYALTNCWTPEHNALPPLSAKGGAIAIEHIKLACETIVLAPRPRR